MLVLTRKHNETLNIGNDIVITIVRVRGDSVRIGIQAPKDIHVMRSELIDKSERNKPSDVSIPLPAQASPVADSQQTTPQSDSEPAPNENTEVSKDGPLAKFVKLTPKVELATAS